MGFWQKMFDFWWPNYTCAACGCEINTSDNPYLCAKCMANLPVVTDKLTTHFAPFRYAEPIRSMILRLKYQANGDIAKAIAPYLAAVYLQHIKGDKSHVIVPVPLHRSRERERGYNQSLVLAQALTAYVDLPIVAGVLIRPQKTVIQKQMDAATRAANMQGAFAVAPERANELAGRDVLLLDDVYTTGATTQNCAAVLQQCGVRSVDILTIATVGTDEV